ncbi:MAG: DUF2087 domain-containing protein [Clostridiales bacterium]|nr:DUF2087 domain-containing protein [Clostridiales bacterium]
MDIPLLLKHYLDAEGRLLRYPSRQKYKVPALFYLAGKFDPERSYTEKEINAVLNLWHVFNDAAMLRRDLFDRRFLGREPDGSRYWLEKEQPLPITTL